MAQNTKKQKLSNGESSAEQQGSEQAPTGQFATTPFWMTPVCGTPRPAGTPRPIWAMHDGRSYFNMGLDTYRVPMTLHAENRARLREALLARSNNGLVLLKGGQLETRHDTDHEYVFRQESYFHWVVGTAEPGQYVCVDLEHCSGTAYTTLFVPRTPPEDAAWTGTIWPVEYFKAKYEVDQCCFVDEIPDFLSKLVDGHQKATETPKIKVHVLYGKNSDSGNFSEPASFDSICTSPLKHGKVWTQSFDVVKDALFPIIADLRVHKTRSELALMRHVSKVSSEAHVEVMRTARAGMTEYQLESLFHHNIYSKAGCRHLAYTCISACGPNSATLHYGHAGAPNDRTIQHSDIAMLDMGAEYHCYCSDISCSFPVSGKFSADQRAIWEIELQAVRAVMDSIRPGVMWPDLHRKANRVILKGLKDIGLLRGDVDEMETKHVGAVFFPCGMGHFIGCDTHDVGGYLEGCPERVMQPGIRSLRTARQLEEGMCLTVEPGIYFVNSSIDAALVNPILAPFLVKEKLDKFRIFGGVRLEDVIVVTKDSFENFSLCPRSVEEIEAVMAGGTWPPEKDTVSWLRRKWN